MVTMRHGLQVMDITVTDSPYRRIFAEIIPVITTLHVASANMEDLMARPRVAIVGSRKVTPYGRAVTARLASDLARQGVVIVSGLAYGVDAVAHRAALDVGGLTIAVLPSSIEEVYPAAHGNLAKQIVAQGGALISEYAAGTPTYKNQFIERNRIVSGISNALLITEAAINSGTMHTARFALDQGKDVLAVPGAITSSTSAGTNNLIKSGARLISNTTDVLSALGLKPLKHQAVRGSTPHEQHILDLLQNNVSDGSDLLSQSKLSPSEFNQALTMMEITGKITALGANHWAIT